MTALTVREFRDKLADTVNRVLYTGEPVTVTRKGKNVAVLVSAEEYRAFQAWEDRQDAEAANKALLEWEAEGRPTVTMEEAQHRFEERLAQGKQS